jgi:hypothetical protein
MARGYICLAVAACLLTASSSTHQIGLTTSDPGAPCLAHSIRRGLSTEISRRTAQAVPSRFRFLTPRRAVLTDWSVFCSQIGLTTSLMCSKQQ